MTDAECDLLLYLAASKGMSDRNHPVHKKYKAVKDEQAKQPPSYKPPSYYGISTADRLFLLEHAQDTTPRQSHYQSSPTVAAKQANADWAELKKFADNNKATVQQPKSPFYRLPNNEQCYCNLCALYEPTINSPTYKVGDFIDSITGVKPDGWCQCSLCKLNRELEIAANQAMAFL